MRVMISTIRLAVPLLALALLILPETARAIPPPDFLVNGAAQVMQVVALVSIFCSAGATYLLQRFRALPRKPLWLFISWVICTAVGIGGYVAFYSN